RLRLAEEEVAALAEGEVEARQDSSLRVGVEVHQRVAAHEDVDAGDGRVLHQIVPPEDHGAPQVLAEYHVVAVGLEVALDLLAIERPLYGTRPVAAETGGGEGLVVG